MIRELWTLVKMLFGTRPSDHVCNGMGIVEMKHFPVKGYQAMAWCGNIIHRVGTSEVDDVTMNHERIHLKQAMLCGDSWVRYYLAYLWEWLRRGFLAPMSANYYVSRYESEAYANEEDTGYCADYDGSNLQKYSIKKAKKLYRQLGGTASAWKEYVKGL